MKIFWRRVCDFQNREIEGKKGLRFERGGVLPSGATVSWPAGWVKKREREMGCKWLCVCRWFFFSGEEMRVVEGSENSWGFLSTRLREI